MFLAAATSCLHAAKGLIEAAVPLRADVSLFPKRGKARLRAHGGETCNGCLCQASATPQPTNEPPSCAGLQRISPLLWPVAPHRGGLTSLNRCLLGTLDDRPVPSSSQSVRLERQARCVAGAHAACRAQRKTRASSINLASRRYLTPHRPRQALGCPRPEQTRRWAETSRVCLPELRS